MVSFMPTGLSPFQNNVSITGFMNLGSSGPGSGTTESSVQTTWRTAGTFQNLYVNVSTNGITANTTISYRSGGVTGNNTVTYGSGVTGEMTDTTHTGASGDAVSAGNLVNYIIVSGGTGTNIKVDIAAMQFVPTTATNTVCKLSCTNTITDTTAAATYYNPPIGGLALNVTEANGQFKNKATATIQNLVVMVSANTASVATVTSRKNTAAGNLTVSITSGTTGQFEDTTHSDSVASGDLINYALNSTITTSLSLTLIGTDYVSTSGQTHYMTGLSSGVAFLRLTTNFLTITGRLAAYGTENQASCKTGLTLTASNLEGFCSANTGTTGVVTFRKNTADGNQTISFAGTGYSEDTTHTDAVTVTDEINYKEAGGNGSAGTAATLTNLGFLATYLAPFIDEELATSAANMLNRVGALVQAFFADEEVVPAVSSFFLDQEEGVISLPAVTQAGTTIAAIYDDALPQNFYVDQEDFIAPPLMKTTTAPVSQDEGDYVQRFALNQEEGTPVVGVEAVSYVPTIIPYDDVLAQNFYIDQEDLPQRSFAQSVVIVPYGPTDEDPWPQNVFFDQEESVGLLSAASQRTSMLVTVVPYDDCMAQNFYVDQEDLPIRSSLMPTVNLPPPLTDEDPTAPLFNFYLDQQDFAAPPSMDVSIRVTTIPDVDERVTPSTINFDLEDFLQPPPMTTWPLRQVTWMDEDPGANLTSFYLDQQDLQPSRSSMTLSPTMPPVTDEDPATIVMFALDQEDLPQRSFSMTLALIATPVADEDPLQTSRTLDQEDASPPVARMVTTTVVTTLPEPDELVSRLSVDQEDVLPPSQMIVNLAPTIIPDTHELPQNFGLDQEDQPICSVVMVLAPPVRPITDEDPLRSQLLIEQEDAAPVVIFNNQWVMTVLPFTDEILLPPGVFFLTDDWVLPPQFQDVAIRSTQLGLPWFDEVNNFVVIVVDFEFVVADRATNFSVDDDRGFVFYVN